MNRITQYIIILLCLASNLNGAVSINQIRPVDFNFRETTSTEMVLTFSLDDIELKTVNYDGNYFTDVDINGTDFYQLVGAPKLPFIRKLIKIPINGTIEYKISINSEEILDLAQTNFPNPVFPVQPFRRKTDTNQRPIIINQEIYKTNDFYSTGIVNTHEPFNMGGISGIMLDFFPVSYNPVRHTLKLITNATITVTIIEESSLQKSTRVNSDHHPDLDRLARDIFINYAKTDSPIKRMAPLNFLVIAGDQFADNADLQMYLNWKRQCGYNTILKSVSELGDTTNLIKNFIYEQYSTEGSVAYILLVGDVADVPTWKIIYENVETETDAPYTRMDNDYIPDLMVGRFSASDSSDLSAIIQKSWAYERCEVSSPDAYNKMTFIATNDADYWEFAEASHNYVIDTYLTNRGINADHIKAHSGGSTLDILNAINDGRTICHYSGHGLETEWQGPRFLQSNIRGLNSGSVPAFVISNACLTGSFAESECFGESWIRTGDKGAFAFVGASNSTYWEPDDMMERGMYDGFFNDGETSIGSMLYQGLFNVFSRTAASDDWTYKYYYDVYNILGDPSIKPWIGTPKSTFVDYNPNVALNTDNYFVSVMNESGAVENAVVTLLQNGNLIAYAKTGIDGIAALPIGVGSLQLGDLLLTITGYQQIPFTDTLIVVNPLNVSFEPSTIPVGMVTNMSVKVSDDSLDTVANVEMYASGWMVHGDSLLGITDSVGMLQFQLLPQYGEIIKIKGKFPGETGYVFIETLPVTGAAQLASPEILVGVDQLNLKNSLIPGYEGQISGSAGESGFRIAVRGCGIDTLAIGNSLQVIPDTVGTLLTALLKPGCEIFEKTVPVSKAFGTVTGIVWDIDQQPLADVIISGYRYPDTVNSIFTATSNNAGEFSYPVPVELGYYQIRAQVFGYQTHILVDTVKAGSNAFMIELLESPFIPVSGRITGGFLEKPLNAVLTITEYSTGSGKYYTSIETVAENNGMYNIELPSGDYEFSAAAMRYIAKTVPVYIGDQAIEIHFHLDTTRASLLLIDDDGGKRSIDKSSTFTVDETKGKGSSAAEIQNVLETAGYFVFKTVYTSELLDVINDYDVVISSSGSNMNPVENSDYRSMLETYVADSGRLLIEGGEVGYDAGSVPGYPEFAQNVL
ncbi:MAG: hypothetical protein JXR87_02905, partial [Candidatus Marinimicrobia bacterium]|nr:hypothetical protein [Candidatus Neomarinimicrobiota bacterium]